MRLRRRLLERSRLYLILDKDTLNRPLPGISKKLLKSGVDIIQLRDKSSSPEVFLREAILLNKKIQGTGTLFIVNDNPDIARLSGSDGLHIGQQDISVQEARLKLGRNRIIGVSCSNLREALKAQEEGADYIGIGPVFKTKTKQACLPIGTKCLNSLSKRVKIPVFAIGNINYANLDKILSSGINRIALCRAILKSKDRIRSVKIFSAKLKGTNDAVRIR